MKRKKTPFDGVWRGYEPVTKLGLQRAAHLSAQDVLAQISFLVVRYEMNQYK